jgi:hypothetical protein
MSLIVLPSIIILNGNNTTNIDDSLDCICFPCCFPCIKWRRKRQYEKEQRQKENHKDPEITKKLDLCKNALGPEVFNLLIRGSHNEMVVNHCSTLPERIQEMIFKENIFAFSNLEKLDYLYYRVVKT